MPEAWELSPDETRHANNIVLFILFCEDEVNEPSYFKDFAKPGKVEITIVGNQLSNIKNVRNALKYCKKNGLLDKMDNKPVVKADILNHIWSVYDRDVNLDNKDPEKQEDDNLEFTASIVSAESSGIKVAWSNDVFELWILLHFEDITPAVAINREHVYARLTEIFKTLPDQSEGLLAITSKPRFNYKYSLKGGKGFVPYVRPYLTSMRPKAIQRAQALEAAFNAEYLYHEMVPCTMVHKLVNNLLRFH